MSTALSSDGPARPGFIVRETRDINRLMFRLCTHWTLPRVQIRIDSLPAVFAQLMQHRITRIIESPAGGLGLILAAALFVAGTYAGWSSFHSMIWTPMQIRQRLLLLTIAAAYAGVLGMGLGAAWTRIRLMRELHRLRRVATGNTSREPARYGGRVTREAARADAALSVHAAALAEAGALVDGAPENGEDIILRQSVLSRRRRTGVDLRTRTDLRRLFVHLFTHWKLPCVRIHVDGIAPLDVQYAQHRLAKLSEACNCALGACLAAVTILGGTFAVEWQSSRAWDWMVPESWGALGVVPVAALCAALGGVAIEMIWIRVRILRVARDVRHRLDT